jgi:cytochrome c peroxidase
MNKTYLILAFSSLTLACGGNQEDTTDKTKTKGSVSLYISAEDKDLFSKSQTFFKAIPAIAENSKNAVTDEKVALGKTLYLDTRLSKDGNISCNSCHKLDSYGVDNLSTSPGDLGKNGDRNSPTVYNAALHTTQFWDGRAADVEEQAGMPILNPVEMNIPDEAFLVKRLKAIDAYKTLFTKAFPGESDPVTYANLARAIGAFERTLMTPSRFDDFLNGDEKALTKEEKEGLGEFINTGCVTCHTGPALGGNMFQKFGVYGNYWELTGSKKIDEGRSAHTGNEVEKYMFKVPSLRNIEKTSPYLHDGSVSELKQVIKIMAKLQLNKDLSEEQIQRIETFLKSLTGELPATAT